MSCQNCWGGDFNDIFISKIGRFHQFFSSKKNILRWPMLFFYGSEELFHHPLVLDGGKFFMWCTPQHPQHQNAEKHQDAKTVEVDLDIVACRWWWTIYPANHLMRWIWCSLQCSKLSQLFWRILIYFVHPSMAIKGYVWHTTLKSL